VQDTPNLVAERGYVKLIQCDHDIALLCHRLIGFVAQSVMAQINFFSNFSE